MEVTCAADDDLPPYHGGALHLCHLVCRPFASNHADKTDSADSRKLRYFLVTT